MTKLDFGNLRGVTDRITYSKRERRPTKMAGPAADENRVGLVVRHFDFHPHFSRACAPISEWT